MNKQANEKLTKVFSKFHKKCKGFTEPQALIYSKGKDVDFKYIPTKEEKPYHIASVGKLMTAVLVLMLVDEGRLNLSDKISQYIKLDFKKTYLWLMESTMSMK